MPKELEKKPRFPMLNNFMNGAAKFLGNTAANLVNVGANRVHQSVPALANPPVRPAPVVAPVAPVANPRRAAAASAPQLVRGLPQIQQNAAQANNPANIMGNFFESVKSGLKRNIQEEFDLNATRVNTPEEDMNPETSKSLLPTFGRALNKLMPSFMDGIFEVFASLINSLLSLFKVTDETKKMVTDMAKPLGRAMVSGNPGEGLANMATSVAPLLVNGLTKFLGVNVTPEGAAAAAAFPQQPNNAFTPAAAAAVAGAPAQNSANHSAATPAPAMHLPARVLRRHSH